MREIKTPRRSSRRPGLSGWTVARVTMDLYGHLVDGNLRQAAWVVGASESSNRYFPSTASVGRPAPSLPSGVLPIPRPPQPEYRGQGDLMTTPVTASERDLRTLAGIVSDHR